ncbi:hypothetical protein HHI36_013089 [Cryptolaemus montrouzieri]|uniref:Uncharacterized protein n=1 Tax=Cryptolaemus montrouzieri TaxID=559131 RepID=A0ABD2NGP6_9CUCU
MLRTEEKFSRKRVGITSKEYRPIDHQTNLEYSIVRTKIGNQCFIDNEPLEDMKVSLMISSLENRHVAGASFIIIKIFHCRNTVDESMFAGTSMIRVCVPFRWKSYLLW